MREREKKNLPRQLGQHLKLFFLSHGFALKREAFIFLLKTDKKTPQLHLFTRKQRLAQSTRIQHKDGNTSGLVSGALPKEE